MNLFWRTVKKFRFIKPSISNAIKPEQWISHFKDLLNIPNLGNLAETVDNFREDGVFNDAFNEPFTMSELQNSIKSLKVGKSGGPDGLLAEMITNTANVILKPMRIQTIIYTYMVMAEQY